MSTHLVSTATTDHILALQFLVGWAGEGHCEPSRLGWWRTDAVDEMGGGDFFRRLAPRTHAWASLEAARRAAMLADRKARRLMADPDGVRTLFFWGFDLDEQLTERIRDLKMDEKDLEDGGVQRLAPTRRPALPRGNPPRRHVRPAAAGSGASGPGARRWLPGPVHGATGEGHLPAGPRPGGPRAGGLPGASGRRIHPALLQAL